MPQSKARHMTAIEHTVIRREASGPEMIDVSRC